MTKSFFIIIILFLFMDNNFSMNIFSTNSVTNQESLESTTNDFLEYGFMLEHVDLALKITRDKQEAINLY